MFLLRHGQSEFNLHFTRTRRDPGIVDAGLTPEGLVQAREAGHALASVGINRIIVSPYTRALQTANEVACVLGAPIEISLLVRERFAFTCDVGTPGSVLTRAWPAHDFSGIGEMWWLGERESEAAVIARAAEFRRAMQADPVEATTLLVSHWGFILALTGRSIPNGDWTYWNPDEAVPTELIWA